MSLHDAELETDLFYVQDDPYEPTVLKRGLVEAKDTTHQLTGMEIPGAWICHVNPEIDGAPEEIARALNRLPKLEALLIDAASALRGEVQTIYKDNGEPFSTEEILQQVEDNRAAVLERIISAIVDA